MRILRYIRFFIEYSKHHHDKITYKIIKQNLGGLKKISKERKLQELKKIIEIKKFDKINSDKQTKELFLLIFPELKNISRMEKLDKDCKDILQSKNFQFVVSFFLIDKSEDCDYFLFKYNFTKKEKEKILFLNSIFSNEQNQNYFTKENLSKILIKSGKENVLDAIDFKILTTKKNKKIFFDLRKYFSKFEVPVMPIKANYLIEKFNLKEGKLLGLILREIEEKWLENNFKISNNQIENIVNSKRI